MLYVKEEVHDVTVLNHIFLALDTKLTCSTAGSLRLESDEIFILDHLGTDETLLEVCVDHTGSLRCLVTYIDGPCTALVSTCCKISAEIEKSISALDKSHDT